MEGFLEHIDVEYAGTGGPLEDASMKLSPADPEGRRITGSFPNGTMFTLNARPVGGRNAGTFQGWITLSRAEWRRITGQRPDGWKSFTVVIGYAPDDETIWWSEVYDDDILKTMQPEAMDGGRWVRFPPEDASQASIAKTNMLQQTLDLPAPVAPGLQATPDLGEVILDTIHSGLSLVLDDEAIKHLDTDQIVGLQRRMPKVIEQLVKWREVREAQSYSRMKAEARR